MTHISKRNLNKEKNAYIQKELLETLSLLSRIERAQIILGELFTKTEKIMLAKRLVAISLLDQNETPYAIATFLQMSESTIGRMKSKYKDGAYKKLIIELRTKKSIWHKLTRLIPPRIGRNRFKDFLKV